MVNYNDIEEGKVISGICMSGEERTGICINVMSGIKMASIQYGEDRLKKDIIEFENITEIKEVTTEK